MPSEVVAMEDLQEMIIEQKILDMMEYAYLHALSQYPKSEKFALVADMKRNLDLLLEYEIEARKKSTKKTTLLNMDITLDKLRKYVGLSYRLKHLPMQKYKTWSKMLDEIGKMLGAWLKTVNSRERRT
ncbi:MAG: diversity-generating retroelement protein Avd [Firmicutes bacterium]|nr:diversity-generating retroelement protein Avd [Bacillota bacterium]